MDFQHFFFLPFHIPSVRANYKKYSIVGVGVCWLKNFKFIWAIYCQPCVFWGAPNANFYTAYVKIPHVFKKAPIWIFRFSF